LPAPAGGMAERRRVAVHAPGIHSTRSPEAVNMLANCRRWSSANRSIAVKSIIVAVVALFTAVGCASAADMPLPQAVPVPPPNYFPAYYNWSGVYLGINGAYAFGRSTWTNNGLTTSGFNVNGGLAGGTLGANYQIGSYVVGFDGDIDWSSVRGTSSTAACVGLGALPAGTTCQTNTSWLGTARARVGYAFDRVLVFGSAGAAFGNMQARVNPQGTSLNIPPQLGWTVGGGVEYAFTDAISAKLEYLFVNLGTASCPTTIGCIPVPAANGSISLYENLVRAGVNYRFSW
jgi:outer membrane immunogenic protein